MYGSKIAVALTSVLALGLATAGPAHAASMEFASFIPLGQQSNVVFTNDGSGVNTNEGTGGSFDGTPNGTRIVDFTFGNGLSAYVDNLPAFFALTSAVPDGNPAFTDGTTDDQEEIAGSFSFKTVNPLTIGSTHYATGANLLSGVFGGPLGAYITGDYQGNTASFGDSNEGGETVSYTSAFLDFSSTVDHDFSWSLNSIQPLLSVGTGALESFDASASGSFSSDPPPLIIPVIPEPGSWALMLIGLGGTGLTIRLRRMRAASV